MLWAGQISIQSARGSYMKVILNVIISFTFILFYLRVFLGVYPKKITLMSLIFYLNEAENPINDPVDYYRLLDYRNNILYFKPAKTMHAV